MSFLKTCMVALLILLCSSTFVSAGLGDKSDGYRMGRLDKVSSKGYISKSIEGQLLMGRESTPYVKESRNKEGKVTKTIINPWYFSASDAMRPKLEEAAGNYVVVEYRESMLRNPFAQDTNYEATAVYPVTKKLDFTKVEIPKPSALKSDGIRVGRIVKASLKGIAIKTWEVMVQMGSSGAQFKHMTITDQKLFDAAVKALKAGKEVKIYYVEYLVQLFQDTNYEIYRLELPEDI